MVSLFLLVSSSLFASTHYSRCQKGITVVDPEPTSEQLVCNVDQDCELISTVCQNCLISVNKNALKELKIRIDMVNGALSCFVHKKPLKGKAICSKQKMCELR